MSKKCNFLSRISPALEKKDHLGCYRIIIITNDQFHFFNHSLLQIHILRDQSEITSENYNNTIL